MVEVSYPGVYIQEMPSGVHTIMGVSTSVAAFFGRAKEGPIDKAVRLFSYADYERTFGPPDEQSELGIQVWLFFQNGGSECYVVRLVDDVNPGLKANLVVENETKLNNVLEFIAKEKGSWGNEIALEIDYDTTQPEETFHIRIYRIGFDGEVKANEEFLNCSMDIDSPRFPPVWVTQQSKLVDCSQKVGIGDNGYRVEANKNNGYSESGRLFTYKTGYNDLASIFSKGKSTSCFRLIVDDSQIVEIDLTDVLPAGKAVTDIAGFINGRIDPLLPPNLKGKVKTELQGYPKGPSPTHFALKFISETPSHKSIIIQPGLKNDVTNALLLGTEQGGIERSKYAAFRPAASGIALKFENINELALTQQDYFYTITIDDPVEGTINFSANLVTKNSTDPWYIGKDNYDGVREKLAILAKSINDEGKGWQAKVAGTRILIQRQNGPNYILPAISTTPDHIDTFFTTNTRYYTLGSAIGTYVNPSATLGTDGNPPVIASYRGDELKHTGFYALDLVDIFNLMIIPRDNNLKDADYQVLWGDASVYCANHRAFLLIDPPFDWESYQDVIDQTKGIRKMRKGVKKDYCANFYPRIKVVTNGIKKSVQPSGAIAGLMARIDSSRGVWKAPAGTEAAINGIIDLDIVLTDMENGKLNKEGVNCIRSFPVGIINWGARTLDGADDFSSEWKYIPIRRLALFIEESLFRGTQWIVFEPNDEPLWAQIRLNIGSFMHDLFRQGAFQGKTPREAYFVKCDGDTTTQSDINRGIVNIIVGFAPLKPAEFVIIKIQQIAGNIQT